MQVKGYKFLIFSFLYPLNTGHRKKPSSLKKQQSPESGKRQQAECHQCQFEDQLPDEDLPFGADPLFKDKTIEKNIIVKSI